MIGHVPARKAVLWLAIGHLAASLAGCSGQDRKSDPSSFFALASARPLEIPIFVASTRREHSRANSPHFSLVSVSVPPNHRPGVIERASIGADSAGRHFAVLSWQDLNESAFLEEIAARASSGAGRDVLLYVHGYDITLDEARFRTAQLVADSGFAGVPALFTWDSISRSGLAAYEADKESATAARDELEELILRLSSTPGVGHVHILAHSMGAWLAMESLRGVAISGHPDLDGKLGEVMLAAPDIDFNVFAQQLARVGPAHVTAFVSSTDRALAVSSRIAGDRPRLGGLDPNNPQSREALEALGVSVCDLSRLNTDFVGHNTFAESPSVVRQIGAQLAASAERSEAEDGHFEVSEAGDAR